MIELKLDGFLLSPIQRICQYPLQLNELLKYTTNDHKDYENIQQALSTMRDVANFINERKRRMEYVEIIHKWQSTVEHWQVQLTFSPIGMIEPEKFGLGARARTRTRRALLNACLNHGEMFYECLFLILGKEFNRN